jgi:hypothetical protein
MRDRGSLPLVNITERRWRWQTAGDKRERKDNVVTQKTPSRAEDEEPSVESFCGRRSGLVQVVDVFQDGGDQGFDDGSAFFARG